MKHIIFITLLVLTFSCKAQSPVVARDALRSDKSPGTYFKDLNNEFNKFEGTWLYQNGSTQFKVILTKVEMDYDGYKNYYDQLFGEYQYIENGTEIVNTLSNLTTNPNNYDNRNIVGGLFIDNNDLPTCDDCSDTERRVSLGFYDPERDYLNYTITLRYLVGQTNPEKMEITIFESDSAILPYEGAPETIRVPAGTYLMEKQ